MKETSILHTSIFINSILHTVLPNSITIYEVKAATLLDLHLQKLKVWITSNQRSTMRAFRLPCDHTIEPDFFRVSGKGLGIELKLKPCTRYPNYYLRFV